MSNCTNNYPTTDTLFSEIKDEPVIIFFTVLSGVCFLVILLMCIEEFIFVAKHYNNQPDKRMRITTILSLYPVVSSMTFLALIVPTTTLIADFIVSLFLSICILQFTHLIISYFGGDDGLILALKDEKISFQTPPCCCCCVCLPKATMSKRVLLFVKIMVYQLCFVRPFVLFLILVLWTDSKYTPDDQNDFSKPAIYFNIFGGISTVFGIYGMLILYRNTRNKLRSKQIIPKFAAVQLMFLFINIQSVLLGLLGRSDRLPCVGTRGSNLRASRVHFFTLSIETFLLAILARFAYRRIEADVADAEDNIENKGINNVGYKDDKNYQATSVNLDLADQSITKSTNSNDNRDTH